MKEVSYFRHSAHVRNYTGNWNTVDHVSHTYFVSLITSLGVPSLFQFRFNVWKAWFSATLANEWLQKCPNQEGRESFDFPMSPPLISVWLCWLSRSFLFSPQRLIPGEVCVLFQGISDLRFNLVFSLLFWPHAYPKPFSLHHEWNASRWKFRARFSP